EQVLGETGHRQRVVAAADASHAAVRKGDEILSVGDQRVWNSFDMERALWDRHPGDRVALKIARAGRILTIQLTLNAPAPSSVQGVPVPSSPAQASSGTRPLANQPHSRRLNPSVCPSAADLLPGRDSVRDDVRSVCAEPQPFRMRTEHLHKSTWGKSADGPDAQPRLGDSPEQTVHACGAGGAGGAAAD